MENNLTNKQRFFAIHLGKPLLYAGCEYTLTVDTLANHKIFERSKLRLKSLKSITDEDAFELGKIIGIHFAGHLDESETKDPYIIEATTGAGNLFADSIGSKFRASNYSHPFAKSTTDILYSYDLLRSMGYALPFMGLSVDTLVAYGWLELI